MESGAGIYARSATTCTERVGDWTYFLLHLQVISRAQLSAKVPPSLVVISRVRQFRLPRTAEVGYGVTLRGNCPVFVRSVDFPSPARQAGVRSGDLLLEVNEKNVRHSSKAEVLELLRGSGGVLVITVIAGGLDWNPLSPETSLTQSRRVRNSAKYQKAADFHSKVERCTVCVSLYCTACLGKTLPADVCAS